MNQPTVEETKEFMDWFIESFEDLTPQEQMAILKQEPLPLSPTIFLVE